MPDAEYGLSGIEIFGAGKHNGDDYSEADLDEMVRAFGELDFKPPLKAGHSKDTPGMPALGWVENVRRSGSKLVADFANLPKLVYDAIKDKRYNTVSAEVYWNLERGGKAFKRALKAVALLGAEIPAVANLRPLHEMFEADAEWKSYDAVLLEYAGDWDETKHPRGKGGKWDDGSGGEDGGGKDAVQGVFGGGVDRGMDAKDRQISEWNVTDVTDMDSGKEERRFKPFDPDKPTSFSGTASKERMRSEYDGLRKAGWKNAAPQGKHVILIGPKGNVQVRFAPVGSTKVRSFIEPVGHTASGKFVLEAYVEDDEYADFEDDEFELLSVEEDGVWRTVGGKAIFIKKGESIKDAMRKSGMDVPKRESKKEWMARQPKVQRASQQVGDSSNKEYAMTEQEMKALSDRIDAAEKATAEEKAKREVLEKQFAEAEAKAKAVSVIKEEGDDLEILRRKLAGSSESLDFRSLSLKADAAEKKMALERAARETLEKQLAADGKRYKKLEEDLRQDRIARVSETCRIPALRTFVTQFLDLATRETGAKVYDAENKEQPASLAVEAFVKYVNANAARLFLAHSSEDLNARRTTEASKELADKARAYATEHKVPYLDAMRAVVQTDSALKDAYAAEGRGTA